MKFPPNWHTVEQGTPEWDALRLAKVTASIVSNIFAEGTGKTRDKALANLVREILTGRPGKTFHNKDMDRGKEDEPFARVAYEEMKETFVEQIGFIEHPTIKRYGASPDGVVEDKDGIGGLELKSRDDEIHIQVLLGKPIIKHDMDQMIAQIDCGDFAFVDYGSYNGGFEGKMKLLIRRVYRTPEIEKEIIARRIKIQAFIREAEEIAETLRRKFG